MAEAEAMPRGVADMGAGTAVVLPFVAEAGITAVALRCVAVDLAGMAADPPSMEAGGITAARRCVDPACISAAGITVARDLAVARLDRARMPDVLLMSGEPPAPRTWGVKRFAIVRSMAVGREPSIGLQLHAATPAASPGGR